MSSDSKYKDWGFNPDALPWTTLGGRPARVLVVDDEPDIESLLRQMFRREIAKRSIAFSFCLGEQEALALLNEDPAFEVVLSDIRMPDGDGLHLLEQLNEHFPLLKTVMVTAYGDMENIRRAMNGGAFDFVSKPIQIEDLKITIKKTLAHVRQIRELYRARLEKENAQAQMVAELEKINLLKDEFLAKTTHALRAPLHGMVNALDLLIAEKSEPLPVAVSAGLQLIANRGSRLRQVLDDVLDFSKIRSDGPFLKFKNHGFNNLLTESFKVFTSSSSGNICELCLLTAKSDWTVHCDRDRIKQAIDQLSGYVAKHSNAPILYAAAAASGSRLIVVLGNHEFKEDVEQLENLAQEVSQESLDLDLLLARQLLELHGTGLRFHEIQGRFFFCFSLQLSGDSPALSGATSAEPILPVLGAATGQGATWVEGQKSDYRLLVVDDDRVNLFILTNQLKQFHVTKAADGAEALKLIGENKFDLVILDVIMPQLSGYEVCKTIRDQFPANHLPVILLTTKSHVSDLVTGLECGANDFLTKPVSGQELRARVRTQLQLVEMTRQLSRIKEESLEYARAAGKAGFATTVIHNVGNVLSSLNVSCDKLAQQMIHSRLAGIHRVNRLLKENQPRLPQFFSEDSRGGKLVEYLLKLGEAFEVERGECRDEVFNIQKRIDLMRDLIETQQLDAGVGAAGGLVKLTDAIEESLIVQNEAIREHEIQVAKHYRYRRTVEAHHTILIHILVNLVKNGIEALQTSQTRRMEISTGELDDGRPFCRIADTGQGIENVEKVFGYGYTTKKSGHGYGLHYCARAMEALGGSLEAESEGPGKGAAFTLIFPLVINGPRD